MRLLLVLAFVSAINALSFNKVHLVDVDPTTGNMLFRGDLPTNETAFDLTNLLAYMQTRAQDAGVPFPSNFYLTDVCLNNAFDTSPFETSFWSDPQNTHLGQLLHWPLGFAGLLPPSFYPIATAEQMSLSDVWKVDQLPARLAQVHQIMTTPAAVPQIIYVHCTAGCDRTGEFIGSYRMLYNGYNTTGMYALDTMECGRSPNWFGTSALEWFCLYFDQTYNHTSQLSECESFATCKLFGSCEPSISAVAKSRSNPIAEAFRTVLAQSVGTGARVLTLQEWTPDSFETIASLMDAEDASNFLDVLNKVSAPVDN